MEMKNSISENEVLDKVLQTLNDALDGRIVDPIALDTAIKMTQYFWMSVYSERQQDRKIAESLRNKWESEIEDK